jgi:uncharacterized membrane protein
MVVFGGLHVINMIMYTSFGAGFMMWGRSGVFGLVAAGTWMLSGLIGVASFVLWILLMIKAYQGQKFHVPIAGDIAQKIAG